MLRITGLKDLGGHEDSVVEFNDRQWTCDSYYFWVDPLIPNTLSVEQTLQILLTQWLAIIQTTTAGIRFLPFDFSDQSTGCFECRIQDATITIRVGWSHFEGHRVPPSNITAYSTLSHIISSSPLSVNEVVVCFVTPVTPRAWHG